MKADKTIQEKEVPPTTESERVLIKSRTFADAARIYADGNRMAKKTIEVLMKWDETKTANEICKELSLTLPTFYGNVKKFKLKYSRIYGQSQGNIDIDKIKVLIKEGFTIQDLARLYNMNLNQIKYILKKNTLKASRPSRAIAAWTNSNYEKPPGRLAQR